MLKKIFSSSFFSQHRGEITSLVVVGIFALTALVVTVVSNFVSGGNQDLRQRAAGTDPYCIQQNDWCGPGSSTLGCCGDLICRNQTCQPPIIYSPTPELQRSCAGGVAHNAKACDTYRSFVTCQDGTFSQPTQCASGQICQDGNCVASQLRSCAGGVEDGKTACDGNRSYVTCHDGTFSAPTQCPNNQLCQNGSCVEQQGEQSCAGGIAHNGKACDTNRSYVTCNNGVFSAPTACPQNFLCQSGVCSLDPSYASPTPTLRPTLTPRPSLTPRPTATKVPTQVPTRTPTPGAGGNVRCYTNRDCQVGYYCDSNTDRCKLATAPTSTLTPKPTATITKALTQLSNCSTPCFDTRGCTCPSGCNSQKVSSYGASCGVKNSPTPSASPIATKKPSTTLLSCSQPCLDNNGCNCPSFCNKSVVTQYSDSCGGEKKVSPTVTKAPSNICDTGYGVYECQGNTQTYCIGLGLPLVTTDCGVRGCDIRTGKCTVDATPSPSLKQCEGGNYYQCSKDNNFEQQCTVGGGSTVRSCENGCNTFTGRCSEQCVANTCANGRWCGKDGLLAANLECGKGINCGSVEDGQCSLDGMRCINGNLFEALGSGGCTIVSPTPMVGSETAHCLLPDSGIRVEPNSCVYGYKCVDHKMVEGQGCPPLPTKLPNNYYCQSSLQCSTGYCEMDLFLGVGMCKTRPVSSGIGACYYGASTCSAFGRYPASDCSACGTSYSACCGAKILDDDKVCNAGAVSCENDVITLCNSTGTSETEHVCNFGYHCNGSVCAPDEGSSCSCTGGILDIYGNKQDVTKELGGSVIGQDGKCYQCLPSMNGCGFYASCGSVPLTSNDQSGVDAIERLKADYPNTVLLLSNGREATAEEVEKYHTYLDLLPSEFLDSKRIIIGEMGTGGGLGYYEEGTAIIGQDCLSYHQNPDVQCGAGQSVLYHELLHTECVNTSTVEECQNSIKQFIQASESDGVIFASDVDEKSQYVGKAEDFLLYSEYPTVVNEGFAISGAAYILAPEELKENQPNVYDFYKNEIFNGREYIEIRNEDCVSTYIDIKSDSTIALQVSRESLCSNK